MVFSTVLSAPALASPTPSPLPPVPVLSSAASTPAWMTETGLCVARSSWITWDHLLELSQALGRMLEKIQVFL